MTILRPIAINPDAVCLETHDAQPGSCFCFGRGGKVHLWKHDGRYWVRDDHGFGGRVDKNMNLETVRKRLADDCKGRMRLQFLRNHPNHTDPTPPSCLVDAQARVCPRCKQTAAYVESQQRRAADEGETQVLVCKMCGKEQQLER